MVARLSSRIVGFRALFLICMAIAALALLGLTPALQEGPALVRLDPAELSAPPGSAITLEVRIEEAKGLAGFEFSLHYNPDVLQPEDTTLGGFLESSERSSLAVGPEIDRAAGKLRFGGFTFGEGAEVSGSGVLAAVTFTAKAEGTSSMTFEDVKLVDTEASALRVTTANGRVVVAQGIEVSPQPTRAEATPTDKPSPSPLSATPTEVEDTVASPEASSTPRPAEEGAPGDSFPLPLLLLGVALALFALVLYRRRR